MAINDGAAAVQALRQNAQQAGQNAAQSVASSPPDVVSAPGVGAGQLYAAPGSPGGQPVQLSAQQQFLQSPMGQMARPQQDIQYGDPNEYNTVSDAIGLALQAQKQRAADAGGPVDSGLLMDDLMGGDYIDQAVQQRYWYDTNNVEELTKLQSSGSPMLDVVMNWENRPFDPTRDMGI